MALVTTIGGATSDSYATESEFTAYGTSMGWTQVGTDADRENLRRAAVVIDREYQFKGFPQYQTQALAWPRLDVGYVDGWPVDPDTIPADVKNAQMELAYLIQGGLDPMATVEGVISRAKAGPVEVEYQGGKTTPRIVAIEGLLRDYMTYGASQARLVRA